MCHIQLPAKFFHLIEKKSYKNVESTSHLTTIHPDLKIGTFETISEVPKFYPVYNGNFLSSNTYEFDTLEKIFIFISWEIG